jgi:transcriptional regulator
MSMEIWKPIVGFEDCGWVSNMGRIRGKNGKIRKTNVGSNGYQRVGFHGGQTTLLVHRLVARAFCEGFEPDLQVNHKDGDKLNNIVENLEWVSGSENRKHAFRIGLSTPSNLKMTNEQVAEAVAMRDQGALFKDIAQKFKVHETTVSKRVAKTKEEGTQCLH